MVITINFYHYMKQCRVGKEEGVVGVLEYQEKIGALNNIEAECNGYCYFGPRYTHNHEKTDMHVFLMEKYLFQEIYK